MELGNFSVSLAVKDIEASRLFYEKLGFTVFGGNQAQNWLINAQLFEHVVAASSYIEVTHRLEGTVTDLYGDYRQKDKRKAVVGIRMVLIEDNPTRTAILFQRDYHQVVEVTGNSPEGLTLAWNQGLEQVFTAFEEDLRKINLGTNHQRPASRR